MSVVANVAVNLDATSVVQRLKQIQTSAAGAGDAFKSLTGSARSVQAAVEGSQGGFAKASTVIGVFNAKVKNTENAIRAQIAALRQVQASVQLGGALYQKAAGQIKQYEDALRKAEGTADDAGEGVGGLKGRIAAFVGGLGLAISATAALQQAFNILAQQSKAEAALRSLGVNADKAASEFVKLSQELKGQASSVELTAAAYDVASAGFANVADQTRILEAATKGAVGGMSDLNTVGNAVTSVLNAYGKSADQANKLVDGFIQTQNDGKIILAEYATQIGRLAPTAAAAGIGIDELNAAISTITAQGVPVEATFTGLNQALVSILKPTKEAEDLARSLGIEFNEAGLRTKGFGGLLAEVARATGGSTTQLTQLFGSVDALKAVLPLVNDGLVGFNKNLKNQQNSAGAADKAFKDMADTLQGAFKQLQSSFVDLVVAFKPITPAIIAPVKLLAETLGMVAKNIKGIAIAGAFLGTFALVLNGAAIATKAWAIATGGLALAIKAAGVAKAFLIGLTGAGIPLITAATVAAAGAAVGLGVAMGDAGAKAKEITPAVQQAAKATTAAKEEADKLKKAYETAKEEAKELAITMQTQVVAAAKAASAAIETQVKRKGQIGSIVGAQIDGELKLNELYKIGLERQYKMAKTAGQRRDIAIKIANNEIKAAQLVYQQALANLQIENEKLKLQQRAAVLKGYEILAEGKLQILKAKSPEEAQQKIAQLNDALVAQNEVIKATATEVAAQGIVNDYIAKAAETQYKVAAATAATGLEQKLLGDDIGMSAKQAAGLANQLSTGAANTGTINVLSKELTSRMDQAGKALDAGTQAAVGNAEQFNAVAQAGIESTDQWRERVLAGGAAQQQVAAAVQQTTSTVVAANNIRATSAAQADAKILASSNTTNAAQINSTTETVNKNQSILAQFAKTFRIIVTEPIQLAWKQLVEFLPKAMNTAGETIKRIFAQVGSAIKVTLNAILRGAFGAVNGAIENINKLIRAANAISVKVKGPTFSQLPTLTIPQFAEGGVVNKPTLAMVGEGGEPEYIIPESKMAATAANYLNGTRGDSAIARTEKDGSNTINPVINIKTGPVMEMNGERYVSMEDFERGLRQVAGSVYKGLRTPAGRYATGVR